MMPSQENQNDAEIVVIERKTRAKRLKNALKTINFDNCTVEPKIPLFLLLEGISGIIGKLVGLFRNRIHKYCPVTSILSFLTTANLLLFIIGSFYVYKVYEPNYDPNCGIPHCNKTVYLFSFIYITFTYVIIILLVIGLCCMISGILALEKCLEDWDDELGTEETPLPTMTPDTDPVKATTK